MIRRQVGDIVNGAQIVKRLSGNYRGFRRFAMRCHCGNFFSTHSGKFSLKYKLGKMSCGCELYAFAKKRGWGAPHKFIHKLSHTNEYASWSKMVYRCTVPRSKDWHHYGGRGITVCERWLDFLNFYEDMGKKPTPKHQIDRIDNSKGYSKENCRWVTAKENMQNTRLQEPSIIFENKFLSIKKWAEEFNLHPDTIRWRLKHWGTLEKGKPCQYFKKLPRK